MFASILTEGLFSPILPSPLKVNCSGRGVDTDHPQRYRGGYVSRLRQNALWRHDEILRIRHLEAEIADMQKDIERQKQETVAANERFQRTKKWLGIIH